MFCLELNQCLCNRICRVIDAQSLHGFEPGTEISCFETSSPICLRINLIPWRPFNEMSCGYTVQQHNAHAISNAHLKRYFRSPTEKLGAWSWEFASPWPVSDSINWQNGKSKESRLQSWTCILAQKEKIISTAIM